MKIEKILLFASFWLALFAGIYGFLLPSMVSSKSNSIVILGIVCGVFIYPFLAFALIKQFYKSLIKKEK